jgi:hypothetical protein
VTVPTEQGLADWKSFLESTPANTPVQIAGVAGSKWASGSGDYSHLPNPDIQLHCAHDGAVLSFACTSGEVVLKGTHSYVFVSYLCRNRRASPKTFALVIRRAAHDILDAEVMKLGEYPPFSAGVSRKVEKLLTKSDLEMYRKGTRSEAQGLGVGAATYFRRIVDSQWKLLVAEIRDAAVKLGQKDLGVFDKALAETQFSQAVKMLKDAIPPKLLILDGQNPLTLLYQPLSVGLHDLTDEECLQQAADIRTILTVLLENIADVLKDQDGLKAAAARLTRQRS